jgi:putative hydrolase of the HAD superfamily
MILAISTPAGTRTGYNHRVLTSGGNKESLGSIETLFLDAGGVLLFPNWARVSHTLGRHGTHVGAEILAAAEPRAKWKLDLGDMVQGTTDTQRGWLYFNLILEQAGVPLTASTDAALADLHRYHAEQNLWELVPDDVVPALTKLRALGLRLVVVSNANGRLRDAFRRLGLADKVDVLFDSFEEGVEKPDPRLFRIALERSGARADTTMHVGDLYHVDVVGARAAGLHAVLLDAANLYAEYDCPRVRTLDEVATLLMEG